MSETHIKLCVTEPYFLEKKKKNSPQKWGKGPKRVFFKIIEKFSP